MKINKEKKWNRICPKCGDEIPYKRIYERDRAEKRNTNCLSCALMGRICSKETRKKISKTLTGRKLSDKQKKNISEFKKGKKIKPMSDEGRKNISKSCKGKKRSEEAKKNYRLSAIKRIEKNKFNGNQMTPGYNPIGCDIIRWFNMYYEFNFQHAENGGEICIGGYFPDGIDEKRKTIIEIDEPRHFNLDGTLKEKDIRRQEYLESLGYSVIRIKI